MTEKAHRPLPPGPVFLEPSTPPAARKDEEHAALLERERARRAALSAARARGEMRPLREPAAGASAGPSNPAGEPEERETAEQPAALRPEPELPGPASAPSWAEPAQWQAAAAALAAFDADLRAAGSSPSEVVQSAAAAASLSDFTRALAQTAASMEAIRGLQLLASVHRSGLDVMDSWLYDRTAALLKGTPNALNDRTAEHSTGEAEAVRTPPLEKWRVYQDEQRLHYARVPHDRQPALLRELPLAVLDDFIDNRKISYAPEADGTPRTAYLRARIAPAVLDASELDLLDWADERFRRKFRSAEFSPDEISSLPPRWRFLARLQLNDLSVIDEPSEELPEAERALHDALRAFRGGEDRRHLLGDKTLWGFLELIAPAQQPRRLREHPFYTWWAARRMLKALRNAHRAALYGDVQRYEGLLRAARDLASALREVPGPAHWEGNNALAYITLVSGNRPERFEDARREMNAEARLHPKKRPLPFTGDPRRHFEDNLQLIGKLAIRTEAVQIVNPYLLLGVEHGNEEWKTHWRRLRRNLPEGGEVIANRAKDAIERYERRLAEAAPFVLPLSPALWRLPEARTGALCPSPSPLPRRTARPAESELAAARSSAAREIIEQIAAR